MLQINELFYSFGAHKVLQNLTFSLAPGEIGTLIGSSGSGKTTLFKILTGILSSQSGTFAIDGHSAPEAYNHVAYMMQDDLLLPWRTIISNLMLVGELGKNKRDIGQIREEAYFYLSEVGLKGWGEAFPDQLSGGMRQRVSLARALLQKRPLLLLDEPFAALDIGLREQMHTLLQEVRRKHGTTILLVTHDFRDALALSDRVLFLSNGRISQEWAVDNSKHNFHDLYEEMRTKIKAER